MACVAVVISLTVIIALFYCMLLNNAFYNPAQKDSGIVIQMMKIGLKLVNENESSVFYMNKTKSFYEWTDWKQIKPSSYSTLRNGDNGIVDTRHIYLKYISEIYGISTAVNKIIPVNRIVPDGRPKECQYWHYSPKSLPTVSVIIVLNTEEQLVLLRTLVSIMTYTPRNLLKEIIIVIDRDGIDLKYSLTFKEKLFKMFSAFNVAEKDFLLMEIFSDYLKNMPFQFGEELENNFIKILFNNRLSGYAKSWNYAIEQSSGDVLVFLKSSVELSHNWLPPLLAPIIEIPNTISVPTFAEIDPVTFSMSKPFNKRIHMFYWNWGLYNQQSLISLETEPNPEYLATLPYDLNLLSSTQFAISKAFLKKMRMFQANYFIGSEINYDLSFKVLQCGGRILKIPCSNVYVLNKMLPDQMFVLNDHLFIQNNFHYEPKCQLKQIAEKWIDAKNIYKFYIHHPSLKGYHCKNASGGYHLNGFPTNKCVQDGISKLSISNLNSFLGNTDIFLSPGKIFPIIETSPFFRQKPPENDFYGEIMNPRYSVCLNVEHLSKKNRLKLESAYCRDKATLSPFRLDKSGTLLVENYCLYPNKWPIDSDKQQVSTPVMAINNCFWNDTSVNADKWRFNPKYNMLQYSNDWCLTFNQTQGILLAPCSFRNVVSGQLWKWVV